ncbi:hypothetical protein BDQ17DRAFT_1330028 [Cyathus striatus]|nr:hypothetical protein BDQ17DRAFT_1330028 [Cyathus striatus]
MSYAIRRNSFASTFSLFWQSEKCSLIWYNLGSDTKKEGLRQSVKYPPDSGSKQGWALGFRSYCNHYYTLLLEGSLRGFIGNRDIIISDDIFGDWMSYRVKPPENWSICFRNPREHGIVECAVSFTDMRLIENLCGSITDPMVLRAFSVSGISPGAPALQLTLL